MINIPFKCSFCFLCFVLVTNVFQSHHVLSNPELVYKSCGNTFSCGNITGIGYPFRGKDDPEYCGYPGLELRCSDTVTGIDIMKTTYRVLDINPQSQIMRVAREDVMESTCPTDLVNTTLDYGLFDYATPANYINLTFLYGCPVSGLNLPVGVKSVNPLPSCGGGNNNVYVLPGTMGPPGKCNASVVYPVAQTSNGGGPFDFSGLEELLRRGFDIRWRVDSRICSECSSSQGRCGYNYVTNQTNCYCPDPPNVEAVACSVSTSRVECGMWIVVEE